MRDIDIERFLAPERVGLSAAETAADLEDLAAEKRRLWLVPYHRSAWDPQDIVPQWLDQNTLLERKEDRQRLTVELYRPLHSAQEIMEPVADCIRKTAARETSGLIRPAVFGGYVLSIVHPAS